MRKLGFFAGLSFFLGVLGYSQQAPPPKAAPKAAVPVKAAVKAVPKAAPKAAPAPGPVLYGNMYTTMGIIQFKLHEKEAPITVKNFVDLAMGRKVWTNPRGMKVRTPLYNGVTFHRVIPAFMVQTGDPTGTGAGDVGFVIEDEFHPSLSFDRPGVFGMANAGPRTGSSQFFITEVPTAWLTGKHSIFAQVTDGQDLVNQIARVPRGERDKPVTDVKIVKITFHRVGPVPPNAPEGVARPAAPVKKAAPAGAPAVKKAAPAAKK